MVDRLFQDYNAVINVKDYGATGDGFTNDTSFIQNALDAAFGTISSPHGQSGAALNKAVYFPPGTYLVASPIASLAVTGAVSNGGAIQLTVSTTGISAGDWVTIRDVGGTTEANAGWFVQSVDSSTTLTLRGSTFTHVFTSAGTLTTPALRVRDVNGGHIYGSGRESCVIQNTAAHGATFAVDGFGFSVVERISFKGVVTEGGGAVAFELAWYGSAGGRVNTQSTHNNEFYDCTFGADLGVRLGHNSEMCSETVFIGCEFSGTTNGIYVGNYNSLQASVIGGNISGCRVGIFAQYGTCPTIIGVGFQGYLSGGCTDVYIENSGTPEGDGYAIVGCRSETTGTGSVFLRIASGLAKASVIGCAISAETAFTGNGLTTWQSCSFSSTGAFQASNFGVLATLTGCTFTYPTPFSGFTGTAILNNCGFRATFLSSMHRGRLRYSNGVKRTYDIEAAALTDESVLYENINQSAGVGAAFTASGNTLTTTSFAASQRVAFTTTGTLPAGLSLNTTYYVLAAGLSPTSMRVSATDGGTAITTTTAGTGTHYVQLVRSYVVGDQILRSGVVAGSWPGWICTTAGPSLSDGVNVAVFKKLANVET